MLRFTLLFLALIALLAALATSAFSQSPIYLSQWGSCGTEPGDLPPAEPHRGCPDRW